MIGQQLKRTREAKGMPAKALAQALGLHATQVSMVENGHRTMSPNLFARWVMALKPDKPRRAALFVHYLRETFPQMTVDQVVAAYRQKLAQEEALAKRTGELASVLLDLCASEAAGPDAVANLLATLQADPALFRLVLRLASLDERTRRPIVAAMDMLARVPAEAPSEGGTPDAPGG